MNKIYIPKTRCAQGDNLSLSLKSLRDDGRSKTTVMEGQGAAAPADDDLDEYFAAAAERGLDAERVTQLKVLLDSCSIRSRASFATFVTNGGMATVLEAMTEEVSSPMAKLQVRGFLAAAEASACPCVCPRCPHVYPGFSGQRCADQSTGVAGGAAFELRVCRQGS